MINYETILSLFDDKLTLLQYLTKIDEALKNEQLTDITVTQTDASHVYFTFVFEDGSTIDTPTFTLPAGPQGIQGPQGEQGIQGEQGEQGPAGADGIDGISVTGAEINVNNHLILTLSNSNTIDAGLVSSFKVINIGTFNYVTPTFAGASLGTYTPTQSELNEIFNDNYYCLLKFTLQISENVSEAHYLYKTVNDPTTSTIKYNSIIRALNLQTNEYFISIDNALSAKTLGIKIPAVMARNVYAQGATAGQVLTADGSNGASWETASGGTTLTRYSVTNITLALLKKIIQQAKGNISGYIGLNVNNTATFLPLGNVSVDASGNMNIRGSLYINDDAYIITCRSTYAQTTIDTNTNNNKTIKIGSDGTVSVITAYTISYNSTNTKLLYYNDTEIT